MSGGGVVKFISQTSDGTIFMPSYASEDGSLTIQHRNGVPWFGAPIPSRRHRCFVQTRGWRDYFTEICRCACGATKYNGGRWTGRNTRTGEWSP